MISDKTSGQNKDRGVAESEITATALINSVIEETKQFRDHINIDTKLRESRVISVMPSAYRLALASEADNTIAPMMRAKLLELDINVQAKTGIAMLAAKVVFQKHITKDHSYYATAISWGIRHKLSLKGFEDELKSKKVGQIVKDERVARQAERGRSDDSYTNGLLHLNNKPPISGEVSYSFDKIVSGSGLVLAVIKIDEYHIGRVVEVVSDCDSDMTRVIKSIGRRVNQLRSKTDDLEIMDTPVSIDESCEHNRRIPEMNNIVIDRSIHPGLRARAAVRRMFGNHKTSDKTTV